MMLVATIICWGTSLTAHNFINCMMPISKRPCIWASYDDGQQKLRYSSTNWSQCASRDTVRSASQTVMESWARRHGLRSNASVVWIKSNSFRLINLKVLSSHCKGECRVYILWKNNLKTSPACQNGGIANHSTCVPKGIEDGFDG